MRRHRLRPLVLTVLMLFCAHAVAAEITIVPANAIGGAMVGDSIGKGAGQALAGLQTARAESEDLNKRFKEVEARFFALYPDGKGIKEVEEEYASLLLFRDLWYLTQEIQRDIGAGQSVDFANQFAIAGGAIGGGIPFDAEWAFDAWVGDFKRHLGGGLNFLNPNKFDAALNKSLPLYMQYRTVRDYDAFARAGKAAAYFPSNDAYVQYLIRLDLYEWPKPATDDQVLDVHERLKSLLGDKRLTQIATELLNAERLGKTTRLKDPRSLGVPGDTERDYRAFAHLVGRTTNPEAFAVLNTMQFKSLRTLWVGEDRLEAMYEQHGKKKTLRVLSSLAKTPLNGERKLASGEYAGLFPKQAILKALPLNPDPLAVAQRLAKEQAERDKQEAARLAFERDFKVASEQYDAFREALAAAKRVDAASYQNAADAYKRTNSQFVPDPSDYTAAHDQVWTLAGLWNEHVKSGATRTRYDWVTKTATPLLRKPSFRDRQQGRSTDDTERLRELLGFVAGRANTSVPLEAVQAKRVEAGRLKAGEGIDLRVTSERLPLMHQLAAAGEELNTSKRLAAEASTSWKETQEKRYAKAVVNYKRVSEELNAYDKSKGLEPVIELTEHEAKLAELSKKHVWLAGADIKLEVGTRVSYTDKRYGGDYTGTIDKTNDEMVHVQFDKPLWGGFKQRWVPRGDVIALTAADTAGEATADDTARAQTQTKREPVAPQPEPAGKDAAFVVGDQVEVLWSGRWYPAAVKDTKEGQWYIGYDGYRENWDEWVAPDRIRARPGAENAKPAAELAEEQAQAQEQRLNDRQAQREARNKAREEQAKLREEQAKAAAEMKAKVSQLKDAFEEKEDLLDEQFERKADANKDEFKRQENEIEDKYDAIRRAIEDEIDQKEDEIDNRIDEKMDAAKAEARRQEDALKSKPRSTERDAEIRRVREELNNAIRAIRDEERAELNKLRDERSERLNEANMQQRAQREKNLTTYRTLTQQLEAEKREAAQKLEAQYQAQLQELSQP